MGSSAFQEAFGPYAWEVAILGNGFAGLDVGVALQFEKYRDCLGTPVPQLL